MVPDYLPYLFLNDLSIWSSCLERAVYPLGCIKGRVVRNGNLGVCETAKAEHFRRCAYYKAWGTTCNSSLNWPTCRAGDWQCVIFSLQYGIKKKEEKEAEAQAALEANAEGSLTRPKKAIPPGCGEEEEEEEESILDTVIKYLPGPLQDMFKK